jgi:Ser/Thr protein kinase RdoA (MazF antagonist)
MRRFDELPEDEKTEKIQRLAQKALAGYGLAGDLVFIARGTHTVFRLRAGGSSSAVRISPSGYDHAPLRRELTWLAALGRNTSLPVPEPVLSLSGDLFRSVSMEGVPGTRTCAVLRWIDGERREAELTLDEAAAIGRFIAELHRHAEAFQWPEELAATYRDPAARLLAAADAIRDALTSPDDRSLLCDVVALVADAAGGLGDGTGDVGIIHGDLRLRKLRHAPAGIGAIGFDECRVGAHLDDLSILWAELGGREATQALQQALLDGYLSTRELPASPETLLRAFALLRVVEEMACGCEASRRARESAPAVAERVASALRRALVSRA